jgi:hypothetical protein
VKYTYPKGIGASSAQATDWPPIGPGHIGEHLLQPYRGAGYGPAQSDAPAISGSVMLHRHCLVITPRSITL